MVTRLLSLAFVAVFVGTPAALADGVISIGRIIDSNNLEPIEAAAGTPLYDMAKAVVRVELGGGLCTGFRVGEDLMMTNHHCLASCSSMAFRFNYERAMGREQQTVMRCSKIEAKHQGLDFSLIRVTHESGPSLDSIPIVTLDTRTLTLGQKLFLAGHPAGRMKEMDRSDDCKVAKVPSATIEDLSHTCDTEGGNSGSSVFDRETGYVVGLHWGYADLNSATWMALIAAEIQTAAPEVYEELTVVSE